MSDTLRSQALRIASELPAGDKTRRALLDVLAREITWHDVQGSIAKAKRILRPHQATREVQKFLSAWEGLGETFTDREYLLVQIAKGAMEEALDDQRAIDSVHKMWITQIDYKGFLRRRERGTQRIEVDLPQVRSVQVDKGKWGAVGPSGMLTTFRSPERWRYALVNEWQVPARTVEKLYNRLLGR